MGDYDRIIKENIETILMALGKKLLGFDIKNPQPISEKLQITIEREPDFLKKVTLEDDHEIILHLEFQRNNEPEMVYRMAEYKAIIQRKYQIPVRQYVIYLGTDKPTMKTQLPLEEQIKGFEIRNIHEIPVNQVLESDVPEEIVLSILTDYPETDAEQVIARIIKKLKQVALNEADFKKSLQQLITLSRIRKLEEQTEKQIRIMPITYDIETDHLYKKGINLGISQGTSQAEDNIVASLLRNTQMSVEQIATATGIEAEKIEKIKKNI